MGLWIFFSGFFKELEDIGTLKFNLTFLINYCLPHSTENPRSTTYYHLANPKTKRPSGIMPISRWMFPYVFLGDMIVKVVFRVSNYVPTGMILGILSCKRKLKNNFISSYFWYNSPLCSFSTISFPSSSLSSISFVHHLFPSPPFFAIITSNSRPNNTFSISYHDNSYSPSRPNPSNQIKT